MAENHYLLKMPHVNSPEVDEAILRKVVFLKKLGPERVHFRDAAEELLVYLRGVPQNIQQMRQSVSDKINKQGFAARVSLISADDFAQGPL